MLIALTEVPIPRGQQSLRIYSQPDAYWAEQLRSFAFTHAERDRVRAMIGSRWPDRWLPLMIHQFTAWKRYEARKAAEALLWWIPTGSTILCCGNRVFSAFQTEPVQKVGEWRTKGDYLFVALPRIDRRNEKLDALVKERYGRIHS